ATNAGGSTPATSAATATVLAQSPDAPANTAAPAITGTDEEAQTLSTSNGTWTGSPTSYTYQWQDCNSAGEACTSIGKATSSTYELSSSDFDHFVRVVVTASNASGSATAISSVTNEVKAKSGSRTFYIAYKAGKESNSGESESSPWKRAPGMQGCSERCAEYKAKAGDHFIFEGGEEWPHSVLPFVVEHWGEAGHEDYYGIDEAWHTGSKYSAPVLNANHELITNSGPVGGSYKIDDMMWLRGVSYTTIEGIEMENWTAAGIKTSESGWYCDGIDIADESPGGEQLHLNRIGFTKWTSNYEAEQNNCFDKVIRSNPRYLDNVSLTNSRIEGEEGHAMGWEVGCVGTVENDEIGNSTALLEPCPNNKGVGVVAHNRLFNCGYPKWPAGIKLAGGMHADAMQSENSPVANQADYIYDNVVDGTGNAGEGILGEETGNPNKNGEYEGECEAGLLGGEEGSNAITIYMWNNVYLNILGNPPQIDGHIKSWYSWNNSMEGGHHATTACLGIAEPKSSHGNAEPEEFVWKNNLCATSEPGEDGAAANVRKQSSTTHMSHDVVLEPGVLKADGYATVEEVEEAKASAAFEPLSANATDLDGEELSSSQCTGELASLCWGTTYGVEDEAGDPQIRTTGDAWDVGAYQREP
ncbi:MAG TPA: hypothetical protein VED41_10935, partial [Solirubrobacteraceae bacterium]|nr:hypothetical protein [Solirubrobacteraceae bacterium]